MYEMEDFVTEVIQTIATLNLSNGQEELEAFHLVKNKSVKYLQLKFWKIELIMNFLTLKMYIRI